MARSRTARETTCEDRPTATVAPTQVAIAASPVHLLTEEERRLVAVFAGKRTLTLRQLSRGTGMLSDDLLPVIQSLRRRGLVRQLNTVVESYCLRTEPARAATPAEPRKAVR